VRKQLLLLAHLSYRNSVYPSVRPSIRPSVCPPSITQVDQSKTVQARITKFSWKTLVSGTIKLFHKFEGHPERGY